MWIVKIVGGRREGGEEGEEKMRCDGGKRGQRRLQDGRAESGRKQMVHWCRLCAYALCLSVPGPREAPGSLEAAINLQDRRNYCQLAN